MTEYSIALDKPSVTSARRLVLEVVQQSERAHITVCGNRSYDVMWGAWVTACPIELEYASAAVRCAASRQCLGDGSVPEKPECESQSTPYGMPGVTGILGL